MAFPNQSVFKLSEQTISKYCRVLGHPARIRILQLLKTHGQMYVHELCRMIQLHQGSVSAHLRKLRLAGLINVEVVGLYNSYSLNDAHLKQVKRVTSAFLSNILACHMSCEMMKDEHSEG